MNKMKISVYLQGSLQSLRRSVATSWLTSVRPKSNFSRYHEHLFSSNKCHTTCLKSQFDAQYNLAEASALFATMNLTSHSFRGSFYQSRTRSLSGTLVKFGHSSETKTVFRADIRATQVNLQHKPCSSNSDQGTSKSDRLKDVPLHQFSSTIQQNQSHLCQSRPQGYLKIINYIFLSCTSKYLQCILHSLRTTDNKLLNRTQVLVNAP